MHEQGLSIRRDSISLKKQVLISFFKRKRKYCETKYEKEKICVRHIKEDNYINNLTHKKYFVIKHRIIQTIGYRNNSKIIVLSHCEKFKLKFNMYISINSFINIIKNYK